MQKRLLFFLILKTEIYNYGSLLGGNANAGGTGHVGLGDVTATGFSSSSAFNGGAASGTGIGTAQGGGLTPFGLLGGSATGSGTTFTQG